MPASRAESDYKYDIFLSHNQADEEKVRALHDRFEAAGLRAFFAPRDLHDKVGKPDWQDRIFDAVRTSVHLGVYCTKDALLSSWVRNEIETFKLDVHSREDPEVHRILVLPDDNLSDTDMTRVLELNPVLGPVLRPRDWLHALQTVVKHRISRLEKVAEETQNELAQTREVARQSFDYYRHERFWKPFSQDRRHNLHVFTCGRDTPQDERRGSGGRSSIDKWDYQAAVDITHYFARHHRDIGVEIEQPVSKARIDADTRTFNTLKFSSRLLNRNCIIIGSPDVSDFAEVTLAELLRVDPYRPGQQLPSGFKIIKDGERFSTFYETPSADYHEGVRLIDPERGDQEFANEEGRIYGVMVLADNPFSPRANKILILVGYSGVATRAMSLLLTNEEPWCLDEFYGLDQTIARMSGSIAAVIEVNFARESNEGDDRVIREEPGMIRFVDAVPLRAH